MLKAVMKAASTLKAARIIGDVRIDLLAANLSAPISWLVDC
jgi:hypothetical protein